MSIVLPALGLIILTAITLAGVTIAWRRGVSLGRIILETGAVLVGGIVAPIPFACGGLANELNAVLGSGRYARSPAWEWRDVVPFVASAAGSVMGLCLVSPPGGRVWWQAVATALVGFALATGASFGASFLMQNSWCGDWWLLLAALAIASATVGSYALALGGH